MRRVLLAIALAGCGSSEAPMEHVEDAARADAASGQPDAMVSEDASSEASRDASGEADAAPPGLFGECSASVKCPAIFTHPDASKSANGVCWGDHTQDATIVDMYLRCTFSCHDPGAPEGLDYDWRLICERNGGRCLPWRSGGIPICVAKS